MAENMFKKYTESLTREIEVGANVPGGTLVLDGDRPAVTLAASGGSSITETTNLPGNITSVTRTVGGVGYRTNCAVVAYDGSWLFEVEGVTDGETVPNSAAGTDQGTAVYQDAAGALTLDEFESDGTTATTPVGVIDDGNIVDGVAPVLIGVGA